MIHYTMDSMGVLFVFGFRGSLIPKALLMAFPSGFLGFMIHLLHNGPEPREPGDEDTSEAENFANVLAGYSFVLGAMLTFRTSIAYSRWWEAGTLMQQLRGQWLNAYSNVLAFCTAESHKKEGVEHFQQALVRLMSLIHCAAFEQVSENLSGFEVLDMDSMDPESLEFLKSCSEPCEIVLQWIQRLIVENINLGVVNIAPPIVSRVFQELSLGIQAFQNARKMKNFPFPYPYAQILTVLLLAQVVVMPIICGVLLSSPISAGISSLLVVFAFWAINYIAMELEFPYGSDSNDLPLHDMQKEINRILCALLHPTAQCSPKFRFAKASVVKGVNSKGPSSDRLTRSQTKAMKVKAGTRKQVSDMFAKLTKGYFFSDVPNGGARLTGRSEDVVDKVDNKGLLNIQSAQVGSMDEPAVGHGSLDLASGSTAHIIADKGAHLEELVLHIGQEQIGTPSVEDVALSPGSHGPGYWVTLDSGEQALSVNHSPQSPQTPTRQQPLGREESSRGPSEAPAAAVARTRESNASNSTEERSVSAASRSRGASHSVDGRASPRLIAGEAPTVGLSEVRAELAPITRSIAC